MAERDEPLDGADGAEPQDAAGSSVPESARPDGAPLDEDAAWAQIIAGYGEEPDIRELAEAPQDGEDSGVAPVNSGTPVIPSSFVVRTPKPGPRDYEAPEDEDEGHFVPPEPPPLPQADVTTKFAWLAVLGGPLLVLGFVLFQEPLTWWALTLGAGGFVGGFATLVARMKDRDEDDDNPHGGAVV